MRITPILGIVSSVLLAIGCSSTHRDPRTAADRALEENLRTELKRYGELASVAPNIQIYAKDGTVTLTGPVRTEKERDMIEALVRNTTGVVGVNDALRVMYPPTGAYPPARVYSRPTTPTPVYVVPPVVVSPPAPVVSLAPSGTTVLSSAYPGLKVQASTPTDEPIARRVADQFNIDAVSAAWLQNVTITVVNGEAYLQGLVDSLQAHQAIVSAAQRTVGVKTIYDQLQVR